MRQAAEKQAAIDYLAGPISCPVLILSPGLHDARQANRRAHFKQRMLEA